MQENESIARTSATGLPVTDEFSQFPFLVDFLWKDKGNRVWWIVGLAAFLLQFVLFKFRYPFANYMPDSYSYLEAAYNNVDVNTWPVAYSKFLRLISALTHSDKVVTGLQYFFLQGSSIFFLFSILYFLKPARGVKIFLLVFFIFNPLPLYIANYISADALFTGLSFLWLTSLLWIIFQPQPYIIILQAVLLLACFTVRYNAIFYPLISLLVFILSRHSWKLKIIGIVLGFGLVLVSFLYTSQKMQDITGKRQFSAFGGWQLANNALYMYEHVPANERGPIPVRFAQLETMVRQHMDTLQRVKFTREDTVSSFFYLWNSRGPLIQYLVREYQKDSTTSYFKRWASEGPLYTDYAIYLIRKFPVPFARNFLLPNAVKYVVPPTEFLGSYNMGADSVGQLAKDWFKYKSLKIQEHTKARGQIMAIAWYPVFFAVVNIVFILGLLSILVLKAIAWKIYGIPQLLCLTVVLWLFNTAFSIFASPVVLRYQAFPLQLFFLLSTLLISRVYNMAMTNENSSGQSV